MRLGRRARRVTSEELRHLEPGVGVRQGADPRVFPHVTLRGASSALPAPDVSRLPIASRSPDLRGRRVPTGRARSIRASHIYQIDGGDARFEKLLARRVPEIDLLKEVNRRKHGVRRCIEQHPR